jgi:hypothetical protein
MFKACSKVFKACSKKPATAGNPAFRTVLLWLCVTPALAQTTPSLSPSPDFARKLNEVLAVLKVGLVQSLDPETGKPTGPYHDEFINDRAVLTLPGAGMCGGAGNISYYCEWEAKPNKYAVAVLLDSIVANVSAAVPESFDRTKGQTINWRYAEFTDVLKAISITITCPVTDTNLVLRSYTVSLEIHPSSIRVR